MKRKEGRKQERRRKDKKKFHYPHKGHTRDSAIWILLDPPGENGRGGGQEMGEWGKRLFIPRPKQSFCSPLLYATRHTGSWSVGKMSRIGGGSKKKQQRNDEWRKKSLGKPPHRSFSSSIHVSYSDRMISSFLVRATQSLAVSKQPAPSTLYEPAGSRVKDVIRKFRTVTVTFRKWKYDPTIQVLPPK